MPAYYFCVSCDDERLLQRRVKLMRIDEHQVTCFIFVVVVVENNKSGLSYEILAMDPAFFKTKRKIKKMYMNWIKKNELCRFLVHFIQMLVFLLCECWHFRWLLFDLINMRSEYTSTGVSCSIGYHHHNTQSLAIHFDATYLKAK